MEMEVDWDLHAVVRGYSAMTSAAASSSAVSSAAVPSSDSYSVSSNSNNSVSMAFGRDQTNRMLSLQDPFDGSNCNSTEELQEFFNPFLPKSQRSPPLPPPPAPPLLSSPAVKILTHQKQLQNTHLPKQLHSTSVSAPRSKRRWVNFHHVLILKSAFFFFFLKLIDFCVFLCFYSVLLCFFSVLGRTSWRKSVKFRRRLCRRTFGLGENMDKNPSRDLHIQGSNSISNFEAKILILE